MAIVGPSRRAWVGLGGNVGDVARAFDEALTSLAATPGIEGLRCSTRYRTPAWGITGQPPFINAVVAFDTGLSPDVLLGRLQGIEQQHGRDRSKETRWGPRTLDLDLLAIDGVEHDSPALQLPHPRIVERAFVLLPWAELAPDWVLPGHGRIAALRDALDCSGIEAIP